MTPTLAVVPAVRRIPISMISAKNMAARADKIHGLIQHRAYQIFEKQDRPDGHALDHWCRAEAEILAPSPIGFMQSNDLLSVYVGVPGAATADLEVCVEPRRITVAGRKSMQESLCKREGGTQPLLIFRVAELPAEVDPSQVSATLSNGILELDMVKRSSGLKAA